MLDLDRDDLDADGPRRRTSRLIAQLRDAVHGGRLREGAPVPSTRRLADDLGVSRGVVVRAYEQLVAEGYLTATPGVGTVVAPMADAGGGYVPTPVAFGPTNPGQVDPRLFARGELAEALAAAVRELPATDLGYGDPRGLAALREVLADWLGRTRGVAAHPDQILVTTGYAQGLRLVAEQLRRRGTGRVAVEDPGSPGVRRMLLAAGTTPVAVPVDEHGLVVEELPDDVAGVVVTPAHQFPTGVVLAPARRSALAAWAVDTGALLLEDDYDREYRFDATPVGSLHGLAPDHVIHGGSLSKLLSPALRLGWLVVPPHLVQALVDRKYWSDIATSTVLQAGLARMITDGVVDRVARRNGRVLAGRRAALLAAVEEHLPGWRIGGAAAGLHATVTPPGGPVRVPTDVELEVTPITAFGGPRTDPTLVVGYGHVTAARIDTDVAAIARARPR